MGFKMSVEQAQECYDILVRCAGAEDTTDKRQSFVYHVALADIPASEYRFQGALGFGGKFYPSQYQGDPTTVGCYAEDRNPERNQIIFETSMALGRVFSNVHENTSEPSIRKM